MMRPFYASRLTALSTNLCWIYVSKNTEKIIKITQQRIESDQSNII
jgi:hypothetical protein